MRSSYAGWVVAGVLMMLICTVGAMQQQGGVGRFQLLQGQYEIIGGQQTVPAVTVWRIDTVTGETVMYVAVNYPNESGFGWQKVGDHKRRRSE